MCCFWFHQKDEDIYNRLFICEDLTMYPLERALAHFFKLHYPYTSENGPVVLSGWSMAVVMQQAPGVKYFHSFAGKSDRILLFGLYLSSRTHVVSKTVIIPLKSEHTNASTL